MQKITYLANLIGWNAFDFKYHTFGPYSDMLAAEIDNMCANGWVEESHAGSSYQYSFSRDRQQLGYSLVNKAIDPDSKEGNLVQKTQGLVKMLNQFGTVELEIMATLMYLRMKNPSMSDDQTVELAHHLKPHYSIEEISKCKRIFNIMRDFLKSPN